MDITASQWITQPIATLLAGAGGALVTGLFLLFQIKKNGQLQRALEDQKAQAQRNLESLRFDFQKQLEQQKQSAAQEAESFKSDVALLQARVQRADQSEYQFKIDRLMPFIDALNRSVIHSYPGVIGLQVFSKLRGHLPNLVEHSSKAMSEWFQATRDVSDHRVQVLLAMPPGMIRPFLEKLQKFVLLQRDIVRVRQSFLAGRATLEEVSQVHDAYVRLGYILLVETRAAFEAGPPGDAGMDPQDLVRLAEEIAGPLERSSVVSVPYGSADRHTWLAIWELSEAHLKYEEIEGFEEFERLLIEITVAFDRMKSSLETKMIRVGEDERTYRLIWLLPISYPWNRSRRTYCLR